MKEKTAIVLMNLGGPDSTESVRGFLFNLFNDAAIIRVNKYLRFLIAYIISSFRYKAAQSNYMLMGGASPLLHNTELQASALEKCLRDNKINDVDFKVFVSMRYWKPYSQDVICDIQSFSPDKIVLLPLYPQYSTTTTQSSIDDFMKNASDVGIDVDNIVIINKFYDNQFFIDAHVELLEDIFSKSSFEKPIILFSAHGLPKSIVDSGDPYMDHVETCVRSIMNRIELTQKDYSICYQSKVGLAKWLEPSIGSEIRRVAVSGYKELIVVPISFVSEHIETLVELDVEYKNIAESFGLKFIRVRTVACSYSFIKCLCDLVAKI